MAERGRRKLPLALRVGSTSFRVKKDEIGDYFYRRVKDIPDPPDYVVGDQELENIYYTAARQLYDLNLLYETVVPELYQYIEWHWIRVNAQRRLREVGFDDAKEANTLATVLSKAATAINRLSQNLYLGGGYVMKAPVNHQEAIERNTDDDEWNLGLSDGE